MIIIVRQLILGVKDPALIQNDLYCQAVNPWSERHCPYSEYHYCEADNPWSERPYPYSE